MIDRTHGLVLLRELVRIRRFEERCVERYSAGDIRGFVHLAIGEEAVAVGVLQALTPDDAVVLAGKLHLACWGTLMIAGHDDSYVIPGGYTEL